MVRDPSLSRFSMLMNRSDLGEHPVSIAAYDTPSPLSCPPAGPESWCYPIWENEQSTSGVKLELRSADEKYKSEPIRRFPKQHEMPGFKARSVTLEWPGEAMHAVFYPGEDCPDVSKGRPGVTWHVERGRKTSNSCESPPAGLFKSVRFMKREEYDEFSRAMRQEGGGSDRALSR